MIQRISLRSHMSETSMHNGIVDFAWQVSLDLPVPDVV